MSTFSDFADLVHGPEADWGQLSCGCHPNCGVGMAVMVRQGNQGSRAGDRVLERRPVGQGHRARSTMPRAASGCRSSGVALALLRNYDPFKSPTHFKLTDLVAKFDKCFGMSKKARRGYGKVTGDRTMDDIDKRRRDRWNFLFVAGMWFQDLFNYDFRRTEQCIIPYATQEGEISFCAYNTGVGWRNIIEKMHMTATLTKWYEEHGRHEIFAGGKNVGLQSIDHSLVLREEDVHHAKQPDLDKLGIAKTAREEKKRARDEKLKQQQENERMAKLYRQHVLKETPGSELVQLAPVAKAKAATAAEESQEEVGSFGD